MASLLAVILEGTVEADCPKVEADELRENSDEIARALETLGYRTEIIPLSLDIAAARERLVKLSPSVVFNLVDSIEGKGNLIAMAPMLLAHLGIPFTGATAMTTSTTCDKLVTKQILKAQQIATPGWLTEAQIEEGGEELATPYILKSITEHASFGMFSDSVVSTRAELKKRLVEKKLKYGSEWFAEGFIDGREFNLGMLASPKAGTLMTLPPAEIVFTDDFPKDKPRIVDYAAKWYEKTPEYKGTVRNFNLGKEDAALLESLKSMAISCWHAFGLSGYARVDFRVDTKGKPYVLEVNSNPFLTANEGLGVAAAQAGLSFTETLRIIVANAYACSLKPLPKMLAA